MQISGSITCCLFNERAVIPVCSVGLIASVMSSAALGESGHGRNSGFGSEASSRDMHYNAGCRHAIYFIGTVVGHGEGRTPERHPSVPYGQNRRDLPASQPCGSAGSHELLAVDVYSGGCQPAANMHDSTCSEGAVPPARP